MSKWFKGKKVEVRWRFFVMVFGFGFLEKDEIFFINRICIIGRCIFYDKGSFCVL